MRTASGLGSIVAVTMLTACSSFGATSIFDEKQVAADALPQDSTEFVDTFDVDSARLLGDASGKRYWAVRDQSDQFCILVRSIEYEEYMVSGCTRGEGGDLTVEDADGTVAKWSEDTDLPVPDGSVLLREHLMVTPATR